MLSETTLFKGLRVEIGSLWGLPPLLGVGAGGKVGGEGTAPLGLKHGRSLAVQWLLMVPVAFDGWSPRP